MTIRPIGNRILAEPIPPKDTTDSGLFIPPAAQDQLRAEFKVVAVGRGKVHPTKDAGLLRILPEMQPGNRVIASRYAGTEVPVDGKRMRIIDANAIIAVID